MGCFFSKKKNKQHDEPELPAVIHPRPQPPPPPPQTPPPRSNKRALLCGVSYKNTKYELKGPINDVNDIKHLLVDHFQYPLHNMRILTEDEKDGERIPTRENIEKGLKWLVEGSKEGDSLVFYFAGHGSRQVDPYEDEIDGYDETICPVDFETSGQILDNYINETIVRPLKNGVTLHAIVDACHSGTILDLNHVYHRTRKQWEDNKPPAPTGANKDTSGGLAISISACEDPQEADDREGKSVNGVMTYILIDLVNKNRGIRTLTYGELIDLMHEAIEAANNKDYFLPTTKHIIRKMLGKEKITQEPQLSSSTPFDVNTTPFGL